MQFAITTYDRVALPAATPLFDIYLDVDQDGVYDYDIFNYPLGLNLNDGRSVVYVADLTTNLASAWFFLASGTNTANYVLPICGEQIGMNAANFFEPMYMDVLATDWYYSGEVTDYVLGLEISPLGERYVAFGDYVAPEATETWTVVDYGPAGTNPGELGVMMINGDAAAENENLTLPAAPAVYVAHFAPFADAGTAGSTSVTVRVDGADALTNFEFGDLAGPVYLEPGEHFIEVLPGGVPPAAISGTVTLDPAKTYTLAAIGDGVNQPLELLGLVQDVVPDMVNGKLFVGHLSPFANTLAGTAVDICTDAGGAVLTDFRYKEYTEPYVTLPPGDYDLQIHVSDATPCSGAVVLDIPSIRLAAGDIVDVFAIGLVNNWPLSVTSTTGFTLTP
jgi:hypothetical protein